MNLASEIILGLLLDVADLIPCIEVVLDILELDLASQLMAERAHENVIQLVTLVVPLDVGAVQELYYFVTICGHRCRVEPRLDCETVPAVHFVHALGTFE